MALVLAIASTMAGCSFSTIAYTEKKRIDEKLTESEIQTFLEIVRKLPDEKLPELPQIFVPTPDWDHTRTLPVTELMREEQQLIDERWSVDVLAKHLSKNRRLQRALQEAGMTPPQFVGLTLTIGAAISRSTLRESQDLDAILKKGNKTLGRIVDDGESFASLPREKRHYTLQQAAWLTRIDRARRLKMVLPENVQLVNEHQEELANVFPEEFVVNPFDAIMDLLDERGLPFEEVAESGTDDQIEWRRSEALIGTDPPDANGYSERANTPAGAAEDKAEL